MSAASAPRSGTAARVRNALVGVETVVVLLAVGTVVALGMVDVLPEAVIVLGYPAILATFLVDTFLFNTFLIDTGVLVYAILAAFLYGQAVALGALVRWVRARS